MECVKFSYWLKGYKFTIWTDNNPLTYLLTKPKLDAYELRWVSKLTPYIFDLKHLPGKANVVADALRRDPFVNQVLSNPEVADYDSYNKSLLSCLKNAIFRSICLLSDNIKLNNTSVSKALTCQLEIIGHK